MSYHYREPAHATTGTLRKMGRKTSGGCLLCADRSGAETARRPGDVCSATTEAKRRPWTHGRLPRNNRSLAEDGASEVRGDLMPRADRAGGETLNHGRLPHNDRSLAEDGLQDVRGTSVLQRPKRSGDLGPMGTRFASAFKIKKG